MGHVGRPAFMTTRAHSTKAPAWCRVSAKRALALPGGWLGRLGRPARGLFLGRLVLGRRFLDRLVGDDQDPIRLLVVADAHRADVPQRIDRLEQRHVLGRGPVHRLQTDEQPGHVLGERADLFLLALERDQGLGLAPLQIERPLARLAHGADGEVVGRVEGERRAHRGTRPARSPSIALTVSTRGAPSP